MSKSLPIVALGHWPTAVHPLERLSRALGGPRLWVKRDDLSGLAGGGNKTRKLERLLADALAQQATTVITVGAPQSNHARQTAAAAARYGLRCVLVLGGMAPPEISGNLLLDRLLGATIRWAGDRDRFELLEEVAAEERVAGRRPYIIPYGGSNAIGGAAYVGAMDELVRQSHQQGFALDRIVFASSSGGTQAGLVVGARANNLNAQVLGISVDRPADELASSVYELATMTADLLNLRFEIEPERVQVNDAYLGAGYAVMGDAEREAILLVARTEGLLLDPVYTGRAMAGLIDLIRQREIGPQETVLFWHTGGTPALYAYAEQLLRER
jgi:D-cysteine desulfhydrase family pyridoxal phosphate-dependent enzyme